MSSKKPAAAKVIPKFLNFEKKNTVERTSLRSCDINDNPNLLKEAITGEESWVYGSDIEIKAQSFQWHRPEEPRVNKHFKFSEM